MKFNHSLQFNAVPEWTSKYIDYSGLKRLIYTLEKTAVEPHDEEATLMGPHYDDLDAIFSKALDKELKKIDTFYTDMEAQLYKDLDTLIEDELSFSQRLEEEEESGEITAASASSTAGRIPSVSLGGLTGSSTSAAVGRKASLPSIPQEAVSTSPTSIKTSTASATAQSPISNRKVSISNKAPKSPKSPKFRAPFLISGSEAHAQGDIDHDGSDDEDEVESLINGETPLRRQRTFSAGGGPPESRGRSRSKSVVWEYQDDYTFNLLSDMRITLKKRATNMYVSLCELRSYSQLNKTGFSKALKKYDKTVGHQLRPHYLEDVLSKSYIFSASAEQTLDTRVNEAVDLFARLATAGDSKLAVTQLRLHLREHVVWERNTVWRDMIGMERKSQAANMGGSGVKLQGEDPISALQKPVYSKLLGINVPAWIFSASVIKMVIITTIFALLLAIPVMESAEQSKCLAVVVAASLLWATEAMPLFVTSLLVPFLVIVLRIPLDAQGVPMSADAASKFIFSQMWSSVIMLLLGGFTLAAALSKYQIAKMLAISILSRAGTNPNIVLLTLMFVATFLSMWISNVAAPVLCFSIAQPLLRTLPKNSPFAKSIILGIALASNIGGMASPIASPQNIIALENMDPAPSWAQWFIVAIPVALVALILVWSLLILTFGPGKGVTVLPPVRNVGDKFTDTQYFICTVTIITIILWCVSHNLEPYVGEMGVLALIPIVVFFGTGLLTAEDFNNFLWTIIALAMGGIALGKAVSTSGLLETVAASLEGFVHGLSLFGVMAVFGFMILIIATFVSHTVAALIVLPLVASIGENMPDPHPRLLVMASAFLCSAAMGLPTSGFPNVTAICMTDEVGRPYLTVGNFISRGVPASILVYLVIISLGYVLLALTGF